MSEQFWACFDILPAHFKNLILATSIFNIGRNALLKLGSGITAIFKIQ